MATHTANLLLEDLVVETSLELTLAGRGPGDVHSGLTTTKNNKVLLGGDGSTVQGGISDVGLENLKVLGGNELRSISDTFRCNPEGLKNVRTLAVLSLLAVMK